VTVRDDIQPQRGRRCADAPSCTRAANMYGVSGITAIPNAMLGTLINVFA
jgi:hypothetical protein